MKVALVIRNDPPCGVDRQAARHFYQLSQNEGLWNVAPVMALMPRPTYFSECQFPRRTMAIRAIVAGLQLP